MILFPMLDTSPMTAPAIVIPRVPKLPTDIAPLIAPIRASQPTCSQLMFLNPFVIPCVMTLVPALTNAPTITEVMNNQSRK